MLLKRSEGLFNAPKFKLVNDTISTQLGEFYIRKLSEPRGGYFISLYTMNGCARKVVQYCKEAGAAYSYGKDPDDCNIR